MDVVRRTDGSKELAVSIIVQNVKATYSFSFSCLFSRNLEIKIDKTGFLSIDLYALRKAIDRRYFKIK